MCCRVKTWSYLCLSWVKTLSKFSSLFLSVFFNTLLSAGRMRFLNKRKQKTKITIILSQNFVQLCCTSYLDQVLTQPWTKFWLNLFGIFGHFSDFEICRIHYLCFQQTMNFLPTPKILGTLFVKTALAEKSVPFFQHFFFFLVLLCPFSSFSRGTKKQKL